MRYALFDTIEDANNFVPIVQAACDAVRTNEPKNIVCVFQALGKFAVSMPIEPDELQGEIVDTVEPPVEDIPIEEPEQ